MANRPKKKRTKRYSGSDAALERPVITRISAVRRTAVGQWWFDRKRFLKPVLIAVAIGVIVIVLIFEAARIAGA